MTMSNHGLSKAIEEMGEALQVFGKKLACMNTDKHWDGGKPLNVRMQEEIADVKAILEFLCVDKKDHFHLDPNVIYARTQKKLALFRKWESEPDTVIPSSPEPGSLPHYHWSEKLANDFAFPTETIFPYRWYPLDEGPLKRELHGLRQWIHSNPSVLEGTYSLDNGRVLTQVEWKMLTPMPPDAALHLHLATNFKLIRPVEMGNRISNYPEFLFYSLKPGNTYTTDEDSAYGGMVLDSHTLFFEGTGPFHAAKPDVRDFAMLPERLPPSESTLQWWSAKFVVDAMKTERPNLTVFFDKYLFIRDPLPAPQGN